MCFKPPKTGVLVELQEQVEAEARRTQVLLTALKKVKENLLPEEMRSQLKAILETSMSNRQDCAELRSKSTQSQISALKEESIEALLATKEELCQALREQIEKGTQRLRERQECLDEEFTPTCAIDQDHQMCMRVLRFGLEERRK